jgi:hypothetical protein
MRKAKTKSRVKYQSYTQTTFEFSNRSDVYKYLLEKVKKNKHISIVIANDSTKNIRLKDSILNHSNYVNRIRYLTSDGNCKWHTFPHAPTKDMLKTHYAPSCFVEDFIIDFERNPTIRQTIEYMKEYDFEYQFNIDYISLDKGKTWINIVVV